MSMEPDLPIEPADSYTQEEIAELIAINHQLHKKALKYKMENRSLKEQIKVLEDELEEARKAPKVRDIIAKIEEKNTPKP